MTRPRVRLEAERMRMEMDLLAERIPGAVARFKSEGLLHPPPPPPSTPPHPSKPHSLPTQPPPLYHIGNGLINRLRRCQDSVEKNEPGTSLPVRNLPFFFPFFFFFLFFFFSCLLFTLCRNLAFSGSGGSGWNACGDCIAV